jgi:hypothetical protein
MRNTDKEWIIPMELSGSVVVGTCSQAQVDPTGGGGVIAQTGFQHVMAKALFI